MMGLGRRELLKLGGVAALATTGAAGYNEVTRGSWMADPATLTAAHNKVFGLVDFETMYDLQREYGAEPEEVDTAAGAAIDPADLSQIAAVGSGSIAGNNGYPTGSFSVAMTGSFEADPIEDAVAEAPTVEQQDGQIGGYNLWKIPIPDEEFDDSMAAAPIDEETEADVEAELGAATAQNGADPFGTTLQPDSVAAGTRDGAVVSSMVLAPEAEVDSLNGVETMIEARDGGMGSPDLLDDDPNYESIRGQFDSNPTFLFGALLDPAAVSLAVAAYQVALGFAGNAASAVPGAGAVASGVGDATSAMLDQWVADLRGFAVGGTVDTDADRATVRAFLSYSGSDEARQTGIVQLVDAASTTSGAREFADLNARYEGRSVVIEAEGDTETVFDLSEPTAETPTAVLESHGQ